ncbi:MAG: hypothetical protein SV765_12755 [Pseudomonadota bacterium]|nr:hypothetical protein [Pseudomonadota bacterium]
MSWKRGILQHLLISLLLLTGTAQAQADLYVITSRDNPVDTLSAQEVRKLFLGRLHLFPGTDLEPLPIDMPQQDPVYQDFYQDVVGISLPKLKRYRAQYLFSGKGKVPLEVETPLQLVGAIRQYPNAIGYVKDPHREMLEGVKILFRQP